MVPPDHSKRHAIFAKLLDLARSEDTELAPAFYRIPIEIYVSEERLAQERAQVFERRPLAIAHASQLVEAGAAIVYDWTGLPLVTLRDKAGDIGTFLNVCRHRNTRLVQEEGATRLRAFLCPYHNWSYGLDGTLRGVPRERGFTDLDRASLNLVPVPTEVRHGLVWILADPTQEMDLDTHLAGLGADLDGFGIGEAVLYRQHVRKVACNWKLIQDAFLDGYHVVRLHRNSIGKFFEDGVAVSEVDGEHVRSAVGRKEILKVLEADPEEWTFREHSTFSYTLFPNSVFVMQPDYSSHIALYPGGPDETVFVHSMLTPRHPASDKERDHFDRSFELIDGGVFQAEDIHVSESAQLGMRSGANRELLAGGDEVALQKFHEILNAALGE